MQQRRYPIGIQCFRTIRENDFYYVDKTPLIHELVSRGCSYFLARPRRFGKSLLIDTLRELFSGNEPLFRGLAIHDQWDWSKTHPVVRISFAGIFSKPGDLESNVSNQLRIIERNSGLEPASPTSKGPQRFRELLYRLHRKTGKRVVVLVDEYDKPILDVLDNPEQAEANRDYLWGLYSITKDSHEHLHFVFVTGITMLTMVNPFSGPNHLLNISLDPKFAAICGFTDQDLDTVFAPELEGLDRDEIRRWYHGYHWLGEEKLYNPWDILLLFSDREFKDHWFDTGAPDMLYHQIMEEKRNPMELEHLRAHEGLLSRFDIKDIDLRALMFQAGYLTIGGEEKLGVDTLFALDFPNLEVRESFFLGLLAHAGQDRMDVILSGEALLDLLAAEDFEGFSEQLKIWLAGIPHQWYDTGGVDWFGVHYANMLYLCFCTVRANLQREDLSRHGRADMVVFRGGKVFVLEFKMAKEGEAADAALDRAINQMQERGYADKYRDRDEPVHLVAAVYGREQRNLLALRAEVT